MDMQKVHNELEKTIVHLKDEMRTLRTGRAHPGIVETIPIELYENQMELKSVANITVSDPRTLLVDPWDKSVVSQVEKAIREAPLGLNPQSDGKVLRVPVPQPSEETRREMVKVMKKMVEDGRIRVRRVRDSARSSIINREKNKEISEDDRYRLQEKLDEKIKETNKQIEEMADKKEKEIMTV